jgi:hypothetical protein
MSLVSKNKFQKDFARGNVGEKAVENAFNSSGLCYKQNNGKGIVELGKFDGEFELDGVVYRVEVKRDWMESKTGRLAIEYHNPKLNKPSGILATEADFWIVVLDKPQRIFATTVSRLKLYCSTHKAERDLLGGDNNAMLWLYNSAMILDECFQELTNDSISTLRRLLNDQGYRQR